MRTRLLHEAAAAVDATPALVPILPDLFLGIESLGSSPARVVRMLRLAGIAKGQRLLDLGCGKGAAATHIARTLGCQCVGVDAMPEFISEAAATARSEGLSRRTRFIVGDARRAEFPRKFDAAIMLGLFDVPEARRVLRRHTKPGGVFIIDDAVAMRNRSDFLTLQGARELLRRDGDELLAEDIWTAEQVRRQERSLHARLARNADRLGRKNPRLKRSLAAFLERQIAAAKVLRSTLRPVQWMVRVSPRPSR